MARIVWKIMEYRFAHPKRIQSEMYDVALAHKDRMVLMKSAFEAIPLKRWSI